jgi:hypothetical protein
MGGSSFSYIPIEENYFQILWKYQRQEQILVSTIQKNQTPKTHRQGREIETRKGKNKVCKQSRC